MAAARSLDLPLLVAITLAGSVVVVLGNLVADLLARDGGGAAPQAAVGAHAARRAAGAGRSGRGGARRTRRGRGVRAAAAPR
ncbi:MAG: hypothetical protein H0V92_05205 [Pseudonocardiales bacterium]|nr:hypothetical protein [Pseudonocardiales bacterium]